MSHAAVFMTCQMPLKSGLPSGVRGTAWLVGVCPPATAIPVVHNRTTGITQAERGSRWSIAAVYTPSKCVNATFLLSSSLWGLPRIVARPRWATVSSLGGWGQYVTRKPGLEIRDVSEGDRSRAVSDVATGGCLC